MDVYHKVINKLIYKINKVSPHTKYKRYISRLIVIEFLWIIHEKYQVTYDSLEICTFLSLFIDYFMILIYISIDDHLPRFFVTS